MGNISLLDCTLRDGGYINDWHFGSKAIYNIGKKIVLAGIEYFEIGFVKDIDYDPEYSLFDGNDSVKDMITPKNPGTKYVGMIDMGSPVSLNRLGRRCPDGFDVFRVIFKKSKAEEAYSYIEELIKLDYQVFAQPVGTDNYTDEEFVELIHKFNKLQIKAFYIVDSFGLIKKKQFINLVKLGDENLREGIMLGYHSHNNMQQAMGNATAMTELNLSRDIVLDACVFGMGRGAGNLNMELFAEYMNENFGRHYRLEPMLEIIDEYLNDIYRKHFWGYSMPYYLSAANSCHPNYAIYFASKGTLTVKSYNEILKSIPKEDKAIYSKKRAEEIYVSYLENYIDDKDTMEKLESELRDRNILIMGPGKTLDIQRADIEKFIANNNPIIISLNFVPQQFPVDYVFSCHMRRYKNIQDNNNVKKIVTSNLRDAGNYDYMLNFSSYSADSVEIMENSGVMCINMLLNLGIKSVAVAGMDGYNVNDSSHYVNSGLEYAFSNQELERRNTLINQELKKKQGKINIKFITESIYLSNR